MKKYLVTGASGFLGKIIVDELMQQDALNKVFRLSRKGVVDYKTDLTTKFSPFDQKFDIVIHCAGKAHSIPKTENEKDRFYAVNVTGTDNLLKAITPKLPEAFVFISSVAVYGKETGHMLSEEQPLDGYSPYAKSKIQAEELVMSWGKEHKVPILILRLPLIAAPTPPGNLGKMIKAIKKNRYFSVGGGRAKRSVVLGSDVAEFISQNIGASGIYNLTDGYHPSFREIENLICNQLEKKRLPSIPNWMAIALGKVGDLIPGSPVNSDMINKMTSDLTFSSDKASEKLKWQPSKVINHFKIE